MGPWRPFRQPTGLLNPFFTTLLAYLLKQVAGADTTLGCDRLKTLLLDAYPTLYTIAEATSGLGQRNYVRVMTAHLLLVVMGHKPVNSCVTVVVKDRRIREPVLEVPDDFAHGLAFMRNGELCICLNCVSSALISCMLVSLPLAMRQRRLESRTA
jgi:hypothetical protein